MTEIIGIVLTLLAGFGALAKFWGNVRRVLTALKEVLDVGAAARDMIEEIRKAEEDKVWTNDEIIAIKDAALDIAVQFDEAKDAVGAITFKKMLKLKG